MQTGTHTHSWQRDPWSLILKWIGTSVCLTRIQWMQGVDSTVESVALHELFSIWTGAMRHQVLETDFWIFFFCLLWISFGSICCYLQNQRYSKQFRCVLPISKFYSYVWTPWIDLKHEILDLLHFYLVSISHALCFIPFFVATLLSSPYTKVMHSHISYPCIDISTQMQFINSNSFRENIFH